MQSSWKVPPIGKPAWNKLQQMKRPLKLNVRQDSWLHLNTTTIMLLLSVFYLLTFYRINVSDGFLYMYKCISGIKCQDWFSWSCILFDGVANNQGCFLSLVFVCCLITAVFCPLKQCPVLPSHLPRVLRPSSDHYHHLHHHLSFTIITITINIILLTHYE